MADYNDGEYIGDEPNESSSDASDNQEHTEAFITDKELDALKDEVDDLYDGDTTEAAGKMLEHQLMGAIHGIAKLGRDANAERVRLDANKYLVDRVLGPLSKIAIQIDPEKDPINRLLIKAGYYTEDEAKDKNG